MGQTSPRLRRQHDGNMISVGHNPGYADLIMHHLPAFWPSFSSRFFEMPLDVPHFSLLPQARVLEPESEGGSNVVNV